MNRVEHLLSILAGHSAQKTMDFDTIVSRSGLPADEVQQLLDIMFDTIPARVNRAKFIRGGREQMVYWPTGVISKVDIQNQTPVSKNKLTSSPRRDEAKRISDAIEKKNRSVYESRRSTSESAQIQMETNKMQTEKPRSQQLLEGIESNPGIAVKALEKLTGIRNPLAFLKTYSSKRLVIIDGDRGQKTLTLKPGMTAKEIYNNVINAPRKSPAANTVKPVSDNVKTAFDHIGEVKDQAALDALIKMGHPPIKAAAALRLLSPGLSTEENIKQAQELLADVMPVTKAASQKGPYAKAFENILDFDKAESVAEASVTSPVKTNPFRVAITSDNTVILFGIGGLQQLELSAEDSETLIDFCDGASMRSHSLAT